MAHDHLSAPGTQGHVSPAQADELTATRKAAPTAVLLDPTGVVGKAYGATNTPHMYVVDRAGTLAYMGAIDDRPTTRRADVQGARNYVREALKAVVAGQHSVWHDPARDFGADLLGAHYEHGHRHRPVRA